MDRREREDRRDFIAFVMFSAVMGIAVVGLLLLVVGSLLGWGCDCG